jgi:hypothetical protein
MQNQTLAFFELNIGGCYAAESASEVACGTAEQAIMECEHDQCDASSIDLTSYQTCQTKVDAGACKCYADAATTACSAYKSSPCNTDQYTNPTTGFDDAFKAMAAVMCGP